MLLKDKIHWCPFYHTTWRLKVLFLIYHQNTFLSTPPKLLFHSSSYYLSFPSANSYSNPDLLFILILVGLMSEWAITVASIGMTQMVCSLPLFVPTVCRPQNSIFNLLIFHFSNQQAKHLGYWKEVKYLKCSKFNEEEHWLQQWERLSSIHWMEQPCPVLVLQSSHHWWRKLNEVEITWTLQLKAQVKHLQIRNKTSWECYATIFLPKQIVYHLINCNWCMFLGFNFYPGVMDHKIFPRRMSDMLNTCRLYYKRK